MTLEGHIPLSDLYFYFLKFLTYIYLFSLFSSNSFSLRRGSQQIPADLLGLLFLLCSGLTLELSLPM